MQRNFYRSTTALVMTLSLLQPFAAVAQETVTTECTPELIATGVPCLDPVTKLLVLPEVDLKKGGPSGDVGKPEKSEPDAAAAKDAKAADQAAKAADKAARVADEAAKAAAEAASAEAEAAANAARAEAEAAAAAAAAAAVAADAAAAGAAAAAAAAAAEAAAEAERASAASALADAEAKAAADAKAAAEALESDAAQKAAEAASALADAEAKAAADAKAAAEALESDAVQKAAEAAALAAALAAATQGQNGAPNISIPDVPTIAPVTEAAQAPDAVAPTAKVVTRKVNRGDARSSVQEFDNSVSAAPKADSGGLTNLEKAGLLLLGAVVVGAILNNNQKVVANTGDRVVVQDQYGEYYVYKDDDVLLMQPGATVRTETFADGSTRSFVLRADGTQIVTIRDADGRVQRRVHIGLDGLETTLIDDTRAVEPVDLRTLPVYDRSYYSYADSSDQAALRAALLAAEQQPIGRSFSLRQIREIREVRDLALEINLEAITFATNSAAIPAAQAQRLAQIGSLMAELVAQDPREVFLIEGHTDAIGDPAYNLALSDRRAETVALALSEYFGVPPENMVVQGYGERFLKVPTLDEERLNRRVAVRRITGLLN
ncbi:MAG: OmpA family protein [Rhodobacteraceae bacterium]|nr:OmpA family protein [Paracoccaceae bacterium]